MSIRVCSLESRRGDDMRTLLERNGAEATIVPSLKEIPLADNTQVFQWFAGLQRGTIDITLFMTGVGTRALFEILASRQSSEEIRTATNSALVVARGPKPVVVLREWNIRIDQLIPEPNTWREIMSTLSTTNLAHKTIAIQEYGQPGRELEEALRARGANVESVPVYRWAMPDDIEPLRQAVRKFADNQFDIVMITSAQQWRHLLQVANEMGLAAEFAAAFSTTLLASIGPTATEAIRETGFAVDFEPSHPKMGQLVKESLEQYAEIIARKPGK